MRINQKQLQLQIRVSRGEKTAIERAAKKARMGMSQWVLAQVLPSKRAEFQTLLKSFQLTQNKSYVLAEIHDLFMAVTTNEFEQMVKEPSPARLGPYWENYVAAMIEYTANKRGIETPAWVKEIPALEHPVFGSDLKNLRLYLLTHTPPCFRNRNIFVDASVGMRV